MGCVITLVDLGVKSTRRTGTYVLTMLTLAVVAIMQANYALQWQHLLWLGQHGGLRRHGQLAQVLCHRGHDGDPGLRPPLRRQTVTCCAAVSCSRLSIFALLGMFIMISANNLLLIYLGLELLTLASYALVALRRDTRAPRPKPP